MEIKLDENLGRTHVDLLKRFGHQADRVHDEGLSGESDDTVWERVCAEDKFFITLDLDFSDIRHFPPGTHPGILILRPHNRSRQAVYEILSRVVHEHTLESLKGCLAVADQVHTRVRRPADFGNGSKEE